MEKTFQQNFIQDSRKGKFISSVSTRMAMKITDGEKNIFLGAPAGEGKTFMFLLTVCWWLLKPNNSQKRVLIVTHNSACQY